MRCIASYALPSLSLKESSFSRVALGVLLSVFIAPVLWAQAPVGTRGLPNDSPRLEPVCFSRGR